MVAPIALLFLALAQAGSAAAPPTPPAAAGGGAAASRPDPRPRCLTSVGHEACGYDCKIGHAGEVKCAATPQGRCFDGGSQLVCFDPPVAAVVLLKDELPAPECHAYANQAACGYHCVLQGGALACAATPFGVCKAAYGQARCFDPPASVLGVYGAPPPLPTCRAESGQIACGYNCMFASGILRCAATPAGICDQQDGVAVCFDPPAEAQCANGREMPRASCLHAHGQLACGYACVDHHDEIRCASTPQGSCRRDGDRPICFDPPARATQASDANAESCFELLGEAHSAARRWH